MRPYFSVGEEVILCSKAYPECNGEYVVLEIRDNSSSPKMGTGGELVFTPGYRLAVSKNGVDWWNEKILRKKHKPADQSFSELIRSTRELKV